MRTDTEESNSGLFINCPETFAGEAWPEKEELARPIKSIPLEIWKQTEEEQREVTGKTVGSSFSCLGICPLRGLPEIFPTIVFNEPFFPLR